MKEYVLNYYPEFKCIAGKCKHTCCAGWEMNIDDKTLSDYKNDKSRFSQSLKRGINFRKSKFKSNKLKRCAFLNDDNLCEIIINLGEKSLCQVCRDHPRFRSFFNCFTETGLGFCCESAAKIILSFSGKIEPILIKDDSAKEELGFIESRVLDFRKRALDILQDRAADINDRIDRLLTLSCADFNERDFKKIIKLFLSLERLDKTWTKTLKSIPLPFFKVTNTDLSLYAEQFLVNGIYRHVSSADDVLDARARALFVVFSWWMIKSVIKENQNEDKDLLDDVVDAVRAFSSEVEYSQKNLNKLYSYCYKHIKI